jgi:hypothetical protein
MRGITNFSHASRIAYQLLLMGLRNRTICKFTTGINGLKQEQGDIIKLTFGNWSAKPFRIVQIDDYENNDLDFYCVEYNSEIFTDNPGTVEPETNYVTIEEKFIKKPTIPTDFTIITNHDDLADYPFAKEAIQQLAINKNYIDPANGENLGQIIITDIVCPDRDIRKYDAVTSSPRKISGNQLKGTNGVYYSSNYFDIVDTDWITLYGSSLIGQKAVLLSGGEDDNGIEYKILTYSYVTDRTRIKVSVDNGNVPTGNLEWYVISNLD